MNKKYIPINTTYIKASSSNDLFQYTLYHTSYWHSGTVHVQYRTPNQYIQWLRKACNKSHTQMSWVEMCAGVCECNRTPLPDKACHRSPVSTLLSVFWPLINYSETRIYCFPWMAGKVGFLLFRMVMLNVLLR